MNFWYHSYFPLQHLWHYPLAVFPQDYFPRTWPEVLIQSVPWVDTAKYPSPQTKIPPSKSIDVGESPCSDSLKLSRILSRLSYEIKKVFNMQVHCPEGSEGDIWDYSLKTGYEETNEDSFERCWEPHPLNSSKSLQMNILLIEVQQTFQDTYS